MHGVADAGHVLNDGMRLPWTCRMWLGVVLPLPGKHVSTETDTLSRRPRRITLPRVGYHGETQMNEGGERGKKRCSTGLTAP